MEVQVRHVHAGTSGALPTGRKIIDISDFQGVSGGNIDDWWRHLSIEGKAVPAVAPAHGVKGQGGHVIPRSDRGSGKELRGSLLGVKRRPEGQQHEKSQKQV